MSFITDAHDPSARCAGNQDNESRGKAGPRRAADAGAAPLLGGGRAARPGRRAAGWRQFERMGLVERAADPADRRKVVVRVREDRIGPIAALYAPLGISKHQ
jgi:hypothetical protein